MNMALKVLTFLILLFGCTCSSPVNKPEEVAAKAANLKPEVEDQDDLKTGASTLTRRYADYASYPSTGYGYGVTGYGTVDDRYNSYYGNGYDSAGYGGYSGSTGNNYGRYGGGGYGLSGYGSGGGYGASGGYGTSGGYGANGGYGGWGGNGGLNSYYGYNNPYYQGNYHTGYGYYNTRRPGAGYGNIYNNGITPSLVTGYRGYSRR